MTWSEAALIITAVASVVGAVWVIVRERRKPTLDLANSDQIKAQVKKISDETNARRDLRVLQLENWAFEKVRPWGRDAVTKFDQQGDLLRELAKAVGREVPVIHLDPFPEMPPPMTLPD
ncbi:hypothetical protein LV457_03010 [Mycobacterium sp. MYCO198283]|uniref:hypothetical protein n=1 Tax=Mycobacterium sp. MYCO198283 TaxID=2883505 RepID=UPI001E6064B9|nr:hypothetical protein [Mycobacterium sp. MYCO198283]MCG5431259.1 hypothetical protein [Mycobacterium sp. MYCO198283]